MDKLEEKYRTLQDELRNAKSVAVAFSGGVDSTLLLYAAHETLGDKACAITAKTQTLAPEDAKEAALFCQEHGIRQLATELDELDIPGFSENPPNRCYLCKHGIFGSIIARAQQEGYSQVVEGSNTDDLSDYRPGRQAIEELGVQSPLLAAGLSKEEIRTLSHKLGLPTWSKPSAACLASRFAYGEQITAEGLAMVARAETFLREQGFEQVRVRIHGQLARIEVEPRRVAELTAEPLRTCVIEKLKAIGFLYVTVDLAGYRMGSMNEALSDSPQHIRIHSQISHAHSLKYQAKSFQIMQ